jgi:hypothetical protein
VSSYLTTYYNLKNPSISGKIRVGDEIVFKKPKSIKFEYGQLKPLREIQA